MVIDLSGYFLMGECKRQRRQLSDGKEDGTRLKYESILLSGVEGRRAPPGLEKTNPRRQRAKLTPETNCHFANFHMVQLFDRVRLRAAQPRTRLAVIAAFLKLG